MCTLSSLSNRVGWWGMGVSQVFSSLDSTGIDSVEKPADRHWFLIGRAAHGRGGR